MRTRHAFGLLALLFCASTSQADSLNDIYQHALQNDHSFRAARAAYEAGLENKVIGRAGLLPTITGQVSWEERESGGGTLQPLTFEEAAADGTVISTQSGYTVNLTQPLFDLAAWHSYSQGKTDSKAASAEFKAAQQNLIIRTAEAYFDTLRAVDNFETSQAEEKALSHQLEQTKKRFEVGLTAITEVHEAQASFDNAVANRLLLEGQVGISFEALEVITGRSYQYLNPLKSNFPITRPDPQTREAWVEFAVNNNFGLAAASLRAESSRQLAKQGSAAHLPSLNANLSIFDTNREIESGGTTTSDIDSKGHSIGLTLNVPIFSGGATSAARRQAAQGYIQARETYLQTQRDTIQQARSLHLSVLTDVATVKARKQAITSSQSALDATQAGYEVGTRDLVDVLVSQRALYTAQRNYADTLYTYLLDTLRLKQVAGLLTEQDIVELDKWLDRTRQVARVNQ